MAKKPSMGRQKIKIAKIEVKNHLQVTFSKRRSGLFKKASELCTLCGVEIAIVVFSPAGKVFSFGHPNVEPIIERFVARNPSPNPNSFHILEAHRNASVCELNLQLGQILNELEIAKKRGETLDHTEKNSRNHYWWEGPVNKLGLHELKQLRDAMEELKKTVTTQATKLMSIVTNSPSYLASIGTRIFDQYESKPTNPVFVGSNTAPVNYNFGYCHGFF